MCLLKIFQKLASRDKARLGGAVGKRERERERGGEKFNQGKSEWEGGVCGKGGCRVFRKEEECHTKATSGR